MSSPIQGPTFRWEWNPNSIVQLMSLVIMIAGGGYVLAELQTGRAMNAANIERINTDLSRLHDRSRIIDNHELRINAMERQYEGMATLMRAAEAAINSLASDTRVMRETLIRIERQNRGPTRPDL